MPTSFWLTLFAVLNHSGNDWSSNYQKLQDVLKLQAQVGECAIVLVQDPHAGTYLNIGQASGVGTSVMLRDPATNQNDEAQVEFTSPTTLRYQLTRNGALVTLQLELAPNEQRILGLSVKEKTSGIHAECGSAVSNAIK